MPSGRITLRAVDGPTKWPVREAQVAVWVRWKEGENTRLLRATTGDDGVADVQVPLDHGEAAEIFPIVGARGHEEWRSPGLLAFERVRPSTFESPIVRPDEVVFLEIALARGVTLEGKVTDETGRPVAGAAIGLVLSGAVSCGQPYLLRLGRTVTWPPPCVTDARGTFEWLSFPMDRARVDHTSWVLTAQHSDFEPEYVPCVESLRPDGRGVIRLGLTLGRGLPLEVVVTGPAGNAVAGARVRVTADPTIGQPPCIRFSKEGQTDSSGTVRFQGLQTASHRLEVEAAGCAPYSEAVRISPEGPQAVRACIEEGTNLQGQVVDAYGRPVGDVLVFGLSEHLALRRAVTDATGHFELQGLPRCGSITLRASSYFERRVPLPSPPVVIHLAWEKEAMVKVLARDTGEPLTDPDVLVQVGGLGAWWLLENYGAGMFGGKLRPASYTVEVHSKGRPVTIGAVTVGDNPSPSEPLTILVPLGRTVQGRVTRADGRPLRGVRVRTYRGISLEGETTTDPEGCYCFASLGQNATLVFSAEGFARHVVPVEGAGDEESPVVVNVVLQEGGTVRGTVRLRNGRPHRRAIVRIWPEGQVLTPWPPLTVLTDESGRYIARDVPEGTMLLGAGFQVMRVLIRPGAEIHAGFEPE